MNNNPLLNNPYLYMYVKVVRYGNGHGQHSRWTKSQCLRAYLGLSCTCERYPITLRSILPSSHRKNNGIMHPHNIIGVSLSEPHTSVTALRTCVCMLACLLAWTDHLP